MSASREKILAYAKKGGLFRATEIAELLGVTRQTATSHLKGLVEKGFLVKSGSTRNASYRIRKEGEENPEEKSLTLIKALKNLQEDEVFEETRKRLPLKNFLNKNVLSIAYYSFSEMLNNAIDHSQSLKATISVELKEGYFHFSIKDEGIGIFENVRSCFKLEDEYQAAEHVLKGKQTTDPTRHSGQGIFFTSRIADQFILYSHKLKVTLDNQQDDAHFSDEPFIKGTLVEFKIKQGSKKKLQELFNRFSPEKDNYEFNKNEIRVRLRSDLTLISRSQARRLLFGLEEFKTLTFDFKGVHGIGQGFADEIFRVFASMHPDKTLTYENAGPVVQFMIERAREDIKT